MAVVNVIIPNGGTKNWTDYAIGAGDTINITQSGGDNNGLFIFNTAGVSCMGVTIQDGKNITLRWNNNGTVTINGSIGKYWAMDLTGTSVLIISAIGASADITVISQTRTGIVGWTLAAGASVQFVGSATYRVLHYEDTMAGGTAHFPTLLGSAYPVPTAGGTITATYAYLFSLSRLHGKTAGEVLTLTDALYNFITLIEPEEQIVAGTINLARAIIGTWQSKIWYIKPTGTIVSNRGFFDNVLPTLYSASYYVILRGRTTKCQVKYREIETIEDSFLGADGSYIEVTNRKSSVVTVQAVLRYHAVWDHPLAQRRFLAELMDLKVVQGGELVKFTWHEGHFGKSYLRAHDDFINPGRAFYEGAYEVRFEIIEAPYN
jgi:hypothetical protein